MGKKKRLLVVDDAQIMTDLFTYEFEDEFEVSTARNGAEGIDKAASFKPDVILLDMIMPGLSGVEAARRLADKPETDRIPVVAITGYPSTEMENQLRAFPNFKGMLTKLDSSGKIRRTVREAVSR